MWLPPFASVTSQLSNKSNVLRNSSHRIGCIGKQHQRAFKFYTMAIDRYLYKYPIAWKFGNAVATHGKSMMKERINRLLFYVNIGMDFFFSVCVCEPRDTFHHQPTSNSGTFLLARTIISWINNFLVMRFNGFCANFP